MAIDAVSKTLQEFGGDASAVVSFAQDAPELLGYATLLAARTAGDENLAALCGVYEWDDRPLMFLVDGDQLQQEGTQASTIRRLLSMRGDAPYMGVVKPGQLTIYHLGLDARSETATKVKLDFGDRDRLAVLPYLINARPEIGGSRTWISDIILRLLSDALDRLITMGLADGDAISLVGRALFVRFLADRNLIHEDTIPGASKDSSELFDNAESLAASSDWLDKTFNGDFLPMPRDLVSNLPSDAFDVLGDILRRAPGGQLYIGWKEKWAMLDFAHIPVGVLSQAYERYLSKHAPDKQRTEGGYYTPRHIAELLVKGSFLALRREGKSHDAKVLDPAAGAGVFLVTAFRQLVAERWRVNGKRPDTDELRQILFCNIAGLDINESALRFAALGLYLISIELDPEPEPLKKLRFDNLRPTVLRNVSTQEGENLGSLNPELDEKLLGAFDLVVGNPPWATSTHLSGWKKITDHIGAIAAGRLGAHRKVPIPNEVLDLPFVWRALEWAKPGAQIAFALHARLLFQRGETMPQSRSALFSCLEFTSIINGTDLRNTRVWPEISAPFCLIFAKNQVPTAGSGFRFITPLADDALNKVGTWRIDSINAEIIANADVVTRPEILKIMFRGSRIDLELFDRISNLDTGGIGAMWDDLFGRTGQRSNATGNGYQRLRPSSTIGIDGQKGVSAAALQGLPEIDEEDDFGLMVDVALLNPFAQNRVHRSRNPAIYRAPLLLVREVPPVDHGRIKISVSQHDILFDQSYNGYSANGHEFGLELSKYVALIISSKFSLWYALITSGRFGFEREVIEKFVLDEIPIVPFNRISSEKMEEAIDLFDRVASSGTASDWENVDRWVLDLYGLRPEDHITITETLQYNLPFSDNRRMANDRSSTSQREFSRYSLL